ncbi:uncharacterized protein RSE6_13525 [Rhynchosporium secalis]|uniref:Serine-rich protein n=1 Tax=Rhynchosporium secalis TaxID=38038 RepID=A0A1E1MT24_RHYSE|nr:uncharacterized protein RSE6_13525 [Rhynchosporium secalis]
MSQYDSPRRILHERSPSHHNELARIRLVPATPPQLLGRDGILIDEIYTRTPLPTHPSHFLGPGKGKAKEIAQQPEAEETDHGDSETENEDGNENGREREKNQQGPSPVLALATRTGVRGLSGGQHQGSYPPALNEEFQRTPNVQAQRSFSGASASSASTSHTHQPQRPNSATGSTGSASSRPKPPAKKRLHIHKDNKTFSLLQDDSESQSVDDGSKSPTSFFSASQRSSVSLPLNPDTASNSTTLCASEASSAVIPATPASQSKHKQPISADHITSSPWNYQLVGGLRKVPKTPDLKHKHSEATISSESALPPLPETSDDTPPIAAVSHDLSTKPSFVSTETSTTSTSENNNYKILNDNSTSTSEVASPSSSGSNYQVIGNSSPPESVIHRPRTLTSEEDINYELYEDSSPAISYVDLVQPARYSQESLVVPPLNTKVRNQRSKETLGYYKSRSRESLRTGSLTSISTVLSQQEAFRAIVGTGALIQLPILKQRFQGSSSWAEPPSLNFHPPRSHMNEHPHQWSSQLSTVLSVSDGGTDRNSRSWSSDNGRRSSGHPSSQSRHSRQMLSISSSVAQEEDSSRSRTASIEPPTPAFARNGRHNSNSSIRMVEDLDEYGDGITDMQDLRARPSRQRLSNYFNSSASDNGRTNTMRSTNSSRTNSLLAGSLPTWAKLYYGSGERRYIGAAGSSTDGTDSRSNSFVRTGSPNTDHFPSNIYSPRRRPREGNGQSARGSMEITAAPQRGEDGQYINNDPYSRRFRTWSMSSIWSPHLRLDRRATRHGVWEPPSVNWSLEGGWFGRRNVQIVMFTLGFIFPFGKSPLNTRVEYFTNESLAWMIAAFLPLPQQPMRNMSERDNSRSNLDSSHDREHVGDRPNDYTRQFGPMDEARYESAKWWRRLNRCMSFVGVLVLAAIAVLVVVGIKQGW